METITRPSRVTGLPSERPARVIEEFEQPRYSRRETLLTMFGVLMVMLLGSLDQTIVATAIPHIIADLHGFNEYTWVSTAYLLTSTVTVPIYGKLSDLFGRKPIFLFGIVLFLAGSALSGASQSMNQLIAFRAFQGLACNDDLTEEKQAHEVSSAPFGLEIARHHDDIVRIRRLRNDESFNQSQELH